MTSRKNKELSPQTKAALREIQMHTLGVAIKHHGELPEYLGQGFLLDADLEKFLDIDNPIEFIGEEP